MRTLLTTLTIGILLAGAPAAALQVAAVEATEGSLPSSQTMQSNGKSLDQAVAEVRQKYQGRIVSAVTKVNGNRETHVIKVLTQDGKVKTVNVPGKRRN
jgi:hypothetical protein